VARLLGGLVVACIIVGGVSAARRRRDVAGTGPPEDAPPEGP
jgi:hypothetical protein